MRVPAIIAGLAALLAGCIQFRCVNRGWDVLEGGVPEACNAIHEWLWAYCLALTLLPFCQAFAGPLLLGWASIGLMLRSHSKECAQKAPKLYDFVDEMLYHAVITCSLMAVSLAFVWIVRRKAQNLSRNWATIGPTSQEVLRRILADVAPLVAADMQECSICLEGSEAAEGSGQAEQGEACEAQQWCKLRCGHAFHQQCLLEWLRRARQCPLCRVDLHGLYPDKPPSGAGQATSQAAATTAATAATAAAGS